MTDDFGLNALLKALRGAGLRVGVGEVARLQRIFDLGPERGGSFSQAHPGSFLKSAKGLRA